jgi:ABC-type transporter Mla subunit MlaD
MRIPSCTLALALLTAFVPPAGAQRHADLAPAEVDQLRDAALEPDQRLKLFVKFARDRMATLEQVRTDPKIAAADRPGQIHDKLQNFLDVYDEMEDNIDMFVDRKSDIRKALKTIIEADDEFQAKLKSVQEEAADTKAAKAYEFVLADTLDTINGGAEDHRKLLQQQEDAAKHKKKRRASNQ